MSLHLHIPSQRRFRITLRGSPDTYARSGKVVFTTQFKSVKLLRFRRSTKMSYWKMSYWT
jgi:hypothetical protein